MGMIADMQAATVIARHPACSISPRRIRSSKKAFSTKRRSVSSLVAGSLRYASARRRASPTAFASLRAERMSLPSSSYETVCTCSFHSRQSGSIESWDGHVRSSGQPIARMRLSSVARSPHNARRRHRTSSMRSTTVSSQRMVRVACWSVCWRWNRAETPSYQ